MKVMEMIRKELYRCLLIKFEIHLNLCVCGFAHVCAKVTQRSQITKSLQGLQQGNCSKGTSSQCKVFARTHPTLGWSMSMLLVSQQVTWSMFEHLFVMICHVFPLTPEPSGKLHKNWIVTFLECPKPSGSTTSHDPSCAVV